MRGGLRVTDLAFDPLANGTDVTFGVLNIILAGSKAPLLGVLFIVGFFTFFKVDVVLTVDFLGVVIAEMFLFTGDDFNLERVGECDLKILVAGIGSLSNFRLLFSINSNVFIRLRRIPVESKFSSIIHK